MFLSFIGIIKQISVKVTTFLKETFIPSLVRFCFLLLRCSLQKSNMQPSVYYCPCYNEMTMKILRTRLERERRNMTR